MIDVQKVFPANGLAWVRVARGSKLAVPVPCVDLLFGHREMRYYPATTSQFDDRNRVHHSSIRWRRYIVEDVTTGRELPLVAITPADAHAVAEAYARDSEAPRHSLDPSNPVAVSGWTLQLARRHPDRVEVVNEWLVQPPPTAAPPV